MMHLAINTIGKALQRDQSCCRALRY